MRNTLLLLLLVVAGCTVEAEEKSGPDLSTPDRAFLSYIEALRRSDWRGCQACIDLTDEERRAARTTVDFMDSVGEFRRAMVRAYGWNGWSDFQDSAHAHLDVDLDITFSAADLDSLRMEAGKDLAVLTYASGRKVRIHRKEGRWLIDREFFNPRPDPAKAAVVEKMLPILEEYRARIGRDGVTPDSLDEAIAGKMKEIIEAAEKK